MDGFGKQLIDSCMVMYAHKDKSHRIVNCNQLFASRCGYEDPQQLVGMTDEQLVWQAYSDIYVSHEKDVLLGHRYSMVVPSKDIRGNVHYYLNTKYPYFSSDKKIIGIECVSVELRNLCLVNTENFLFRQNKKEHSGQRQSNLTGKERQVVLLMARGKSVPAIAEQFHNSAKTIYKHIENIKEKLECVSHLDIIDKSIMQGYLSIIPGVSMIKNITRVLTNHLVE